MQSHKNVRWTFFAGKHQLLLASDEPTGDKSAHYSCLTAAQLATALWAELTSQTEPRRGRSPCFQDIKKHLNLNKPKCLKTGGAEGDRTPDLQIANLSLSQLSYSPNICV